jgi:soluble lytic murein transglycosylase-like protein
MKMTMLALVSILSLQLGSHCVIPSLTILEQTIEIQIEDDYGNYYQKYFLNKKLNKNYLTFIEALSFQYQVPMIYVLKLIEKESNWNSKTIGYNENGTYDVGLVQVNSQYIEYFQQKYGDFDPNNDYDAIEFCFKHLSFLFKQTNNWRQAIAAYNAGLSRVLKGNIPITTQRYTNYILGEF